jgi:hypothetical protein
MDCHGCPKSAGRALGRATPPKSWGQRFALAVTPEGILVRVGDACPAEAHGCGRPRFYCDKYMNYMFYFHIAKPRPWLWGRLGWACIGAKIVH